MPDSDCRKPRERLTRRIGVELRRAPKHRAGLHLAAFLAVEDEVAEALQDGYSMKALWELLRKEGAVRMAYETFRDYCRSSGLKRHPRTAGTPRRGVRGSGGRGGAGMPPLTFEHNSVPDPKKLY